MLDPAPSTSLLTGMTGEKREKVNLITHERMMRKELGE